MLIFGLPLWFACVHSQRTSQSSSEVHSERILVFFSALRNSESNIRFKSLTLSPLNSALTSNPSLVGLMEPLLPIIRSNTGFMADGMALLTRANNLNFFSDTICQSLLRFEF